MKTSHNNIAWLVCSIGLSLASAAPAVAASSDDYFLTLGAPFIAPYGNDRENASQIGFDYVSVPPVVMPGQQMEMEVQWSYLNPANPNAVIYLNAFGDCSRALNWGAW